MQNLLPTRAGSSPARAAARHNLLPRHLDAPTLVEQDAVIALLGRGEHGAAEQKARRLIQRFPHHPFGTKAAAAALAGQSRWTEALTLYERCLRTVRLPDWEVLNNYANALKAVGRLGEAVATYRRAMAMASAGTLEPQYNLALTLIDLGRLAEAEAGLEAVLVLAPAHALAQLNLANVLNVQSRMREAEPHYRAALAALPVTSPELPKTHNNLGLCLRRQNRFAEAEAHFRLALGLDPGYATAASNLAEFVAEHGLVPEAVSLLRHAIACDPGHAEAHSNLLFTLGHLSGVTAADLLAEHKAYAERFETPFLIAEPRHTNQPDPERPLRVGFLSADLVDHPLVRYLRPALDRLSARTDLHLTAYYNSPRHDAETELYQRQFHGWREVAHLGDEALAALIRADGIDILIDLSGHTGYNRLGTLARRPAPLQMGWMGYVGTTGLGSIDFLIADAELLPTRLRAFCTEQVLELPVTTTFAPVVEAPAVNDLPVLTTGHFTFGCLARTNKLNRATVELWVEMLRRIPDARLLLATMSDGRPPQAVVGWFAELGIGAERLNFAHARTVADVLRLHHQIDLALDTMPYNGSTTSSHGLWMGVPTLTLSGETVAGRMGTALNRYTGLHGFIAGSAHEYVEIGVRHAQDPACLAVLRPMLRERFARSPLQDHDAHAEALASGLRKVWKRWCEGR